MSEKIKVGVVGAGGKVGLELLALLRKSDCFEAACGIGKKAEGFTLNKNNFADLQKGDVDITIDFSSPELLEKALKFCLENKVPIVSGTTGLEARHYDLLRQAAEKIPVLWAPNMSLGIAVMKRAMQAFKAIKHFDFQVEEWHHRHKKDRPSGTAIYLQTELEEIIEKSCPPTMVMRGGGIFGVHKVYAASDEELIQIEHTAMSRTVFARGALEAGRWLVSKTPGLYTIDDVIA